MTIDQRSKALYASGVQGLGAVLRRSHVIGEDPPPRDRRSAHWAYSLFSAHDVLGLVHLGVPWWTYRAIDVVDAWMMARSRPIRVFEYGSGASTIWLSERADEVISVEHHAGFAAFMGPQLEMRANVTYEVVEGVTCPSPVIGSRKPGNAGLDFSDYVGTIDRVAGSFSLIVVDGRAREACLLRAVDRLDPDGIVVFDNSRRSRYRQAIESVPLVERRLPGLAPTLPYPDQTSVLFRAPGGQEHAS